MPSPVQVLIQGGNVYVGAGSMVFSSPIPNPASAIVPPWTLTAIPALSKLPDSVSGMAFDAQGNFYVAIRQKQEVLKFLPDFSSQATCIKSLGDDPEYLLYVPD